MKKVQLVGIFILLAFAPVRSALAQAGTTSTSQATVETASARNQTTLASATESSEENSNLSKAASEAQEKYVAGVVFYEAGKLDAAISALKNANKLKPNDPQIQYMLGLVYWKAKSYNDAVDSFKRAVRVKPDWAEAHFRLGLTYYVLGRKNQTNDVYKKLLELDSGLAAKLQQINYDANLTNVRENRAALTAKETKVVPVSVGAASAHSEAQTDGSESTGSAAITSSKKAVLQVATPREKLNSAVKLSNVPTPAVSSGSLTPVTGTADGDSASGNTGSAADDSAGTNIYKVGVGDVLDIRLLNSPTNRSTLYSVIDDGLIDFPMAGGPIAVAGLTTKEIQTRITSQLKHLALEERTQVAVAVRQYASHTVIITGLVNAPGTRILRREAVPLYVLLAEVQPRLDAGRVTIIRAGVPPRLVDLGEAATLNVIVRPGDVINVTARPPDFYYIAGRIIYPGQKIFQPGITLVQAILAAGGLARDNEVELSREGSDGRLATTKFNLKEIKSGKIQDPKLQPGDRIEVSH
ncbi:MAG TPA: tetratricopeptide repeat protein [Pyrinomonadaceae bacterium]|nr:tetratricopeptide repeat protein [Pyrinomonadaceae bacterium]